MVDTVEVHYQTKRIGEPIESSEETADVSEVVEHVVHDALNEQTVLI